MFDGKCFNCGNYMTNMGEGSWNCPVCGDEHYEYMVTATGQIQLFFCEKCGGLMKPFIELPDVMVCEKCGNAGELDDVEITEGYNPEKLKSTAEFVEKLSPRTIAMMLMDCGAAIERLEGTIKAFLQAFEAELEGEGITIVADFDNYWWPCTFYDKQKPDGMAQRYQALMALWDAVNESAT